MSAKFSEVKQYLSFFLTLLCIVGSMVLAFWKDADVNTLLPTLLGLYLGARTADKANIAWAASKDPQADTASIMREHMDK